MGSDVVLYVLQSYMIEIFQSERKLESAKLILPVSSCRWRKFNFLLVLSLGCYQQKNHGAVDAMTEDPSDGLSLPSETLAKKKKDKTHVPFRCILTKSTFPVIL